MNFLNVGIPVTVLEGDQEALDKGDCHQAKLRHSGATVE